MYRDASHLWRSFSHNRTKINIQILHKKCPYNLICIIQCNSTNSVYSSQSNHPIWLESLFEISVYPCSHSCWSIIWNISLYFTLFIITQFTLQLTILILISIINRYAVFTWFVTEFIQNDFSIDKHVKDLTRRSDSYIKSSPFMECSRLASGNSFAPLLHFIGPIT